jgi:hypothetical protein
VWGGGRLSRGRRPKSGCKLPGLDPKAGCELGIVAANLLDEALGVLAADDDVDAVAEGRQATSARR